MTNTLSVMSNLCHLETLNATSIRTFDSLSAAMEEFDGGMIKICADVNFGSAEFVVSDNTVIDLLGHRTTNGRFKIRNKAEVLFKNGNMKSTSTAAPLISVEDGKATLRDLLVDGYASRSAMHGLVHVGPMASETNMEEAKDRYSRFAPVLDVESTATVYAKNADSCSIGIGSFLAESPTAARTKAVSAYFEKSVLNIYGSVFCDGYIGIHEFGSDLVGADINVYDGAILSCSKETAISKINGGSINLYGGKIYGDTGICMRYMNSLYVPEDSSVEVYGLGPAGNYMEEGSPSWDNDEHLYQTGCGIAIDRNWRTQKFPGVLDVKGGYFSSENAYPIGSYSFKGTFNRALAFVDPTIKNLDHFSRLPAGSAYVEESGENADYGIFR